MDHIGSDRDIVDHVDSDRDIVGCDGFDFQAEEVSSSLFLIQSSTFSKRFESLTLTGTRLVVVCSVFPNLL